MCERDAHPGGFLGGGWETIGRGIYTWGHETRYGISESDLPGGGSDGFGFWCGYWGQCAAGVGAGGGDGCARDVAGEWAGRPGGGSEAIKWAVDSVATIGGVKAQVLGAPKVVDADAAAGGGKAVHFDGKADGLILPVSPLAGMKTFTIEVLFRPESGGPTEQRFMHSEDEGGNRMTIETRLTADGKWSLDTFLLSGDRSGQRALLDQTKLHPADQWYWVALRYDGTYEPSYINGVKELEGPVHFAGMGAKGRISLGVRLNMVNWFKGEIKEVRIVPRVVAEGELQRVK